MPGSDAQSPAPSREPETEPEAKSEGVPSTEPKTVPASATEPPAPRSLLIKATPYIQVLRLDHWPKNVFTVLGSFVCIAFLRISLDSETIVSLVLAAFISCIVSSVNYVINEFFDAAFDAEHPVKRNRPIPRGLVEVQALLLLGGLLLVGAVGATVVLFDNKALVISILLFLFFGFLYSVKPIRAKEIAFADVIVESVNNPLRLLIGWFAVAPATKYPPMGFILLFWTFGAFLMTAKRTAQMRHPADAAGKCRVTYHNYSERDLWTAMAVYAIASLFLLVTIAMQYKQDLLWGLPIAVILLGWFFKLTAEPDSIVREPERMFRRPFFLLAMAGFCLFLWLAFR